MGSSRSESAVEENCQDAKRAKGVQTTNRKQMEDLKANWWTDVWAGQIENNLSCRVNEGLTQILV